MTKNISDKKKFSIIARARSFTHAFRGLSIVFQTQHNMWIHIAISVLVVIFGFVLKISNTEWLAVVLAMGLVLVTETLNTALEIDIDLTSPTYHPYARDTKDVASGAVFISITIATIIGLLIFLPKIF